MAFWFENRGVERHVLDFLESHKGCKIYWVTFVVHPCPSDLVLDALQQCGAHIVCRSPRDITRGQVMSRSTFEKLEARALKVRCVESFDGDSLPDKAANGEGLGKLHAKMIVAVRGQCPVGALVGSFNLTGSSLSESAESLAWLTDPRDCREVYSGIRFLWEHSREFVLEDCGEEATRQKEAAEIVPVYGMRAIPKAPPPPSTGASGDLLAAIVRLLDRKLCDYPVGTGGTFQWDVLGEIQTREVGRLGNGEAPISLLYLPVGAGKTYIALRWLFGCLLDSGKQPALGLYLAPNQWVQDTVQKCLDSLVQEVRLASPELKSDVDFVHVIRPSTARWGTSKLTAAVVDEVHNWSKAGSHGQYTYSGIVNDLRARGDIRILGLSATPCRIEDGRFDRETFVRRWVGKSCSEDEWKPICRFDDAVRRGMMSALKWVRLEVTSERSEKIADILQTPSVRMGDYAYVTLGDVWGAMTSEGGEPVLVEKIQRSIVEHKPRRVVVYLPPLRDEVDGFVEKVAAMVKKMEGWCGDFRTRGDDAPDSVFGEFSSTSKHPAVLLTVNRFSEGVSVPDVDMLVMLRPTLSPRVVVQQIGRGVRLAPGKQHCVVLDAVQFQHRWDEWDRVLDQKVTAQDSTASAGLQSRSQARPIQVVTKIPPRHWPPKNGDDVYEIVERLRGAGAMDGRVASYCEVAESTLTAYRYSGGSVGFREKLADFVKKHYPQLLPS